MARRHSPPLVSRTRCSVLTLLRRAGTQQAAHYADAWAPALQRITSCCAASGARDLCATINTASQPRGLFHPSFASAPCPQLKEGAGKTGCRLAPAVHCAIIALQESAQRHTGEAKQPAFPAQWLYGLCRALPGERCTIAPVASRMTDVRARLGHTHHRKTWRTGSGRQDHTISPYADHTGRVRDGFAHGCPPCKTLRADVTTSTAIRPAFVTIAIRPSSLGRVARHIRCFRISVKWYIFDGAD
ncbi:hypothetical protein ABID59_005239 [Bradyrhizobium sp. S3.3.6]